MRRWVPLLIHAAVVVALLLIVRADFAREWPTLLVGFAIGAFPLVVAIAWLELRGRRAGRP